MARLQSMVATGNTIHFRILGCFRKDLPFPSPHKFSTLPIAHQGRYAATFRTRAGRWSGPKRWEKLGDWGWFLFWGVLSSVWCVTAAGGLRAPLRRTTL